MLTEKQIDQTIRGAFLPFRCAVEFWDYNAKLRFKVFDHSRKGIAEIAEIPVQEARNKSNLESILNQVRNFVQSKGYALS